MEGPLAAAYGELDRAERPASWTVSNPKAGKSKQHYPLESVTWANGSPDANKRFVSIENEGKAGEPLTGNQVANLVAIMGELATLCPQILPYERSTSVKEHNEMTAFGASPTACPSGRIPWAGIIAALEEDEMDAETKTRLESLEADRKAMSVQIGALEARTKSLEDDRIVLSQQLGALAENVKAGGPEVDAFIAEVRRRLEE